MSKSPSNTPVHFRKRTSGYKLETRNYFEFTDLPQMLHEVSQIHGQNYTINSAKKKRVEVNFGSVYLKIKSNLFGSEFRIKAPSNLDHEAVSLALALEQIIPSDQIRDK